MEDPTYDTTVPGLFAFPVLTEDQLARAAKFRESEAAKGNKQMREAGYEVSYLMDEDNADFPKMQAIVREIIQENTETAEYAAAVADLEEKGYQIPKPNFPFKRGDKMADKSKAKREKLNKAPNQEYLRGKIVLIARSGFPVPLTVIKNNKAIDLDNEMLVKLHGKMFFAGAEGLIRVKFSWYNPTMLVPGGGVNAYLQLAFATGKGKPFPGTGGPSGAEVFKSYAGRPSNIDPLKGRDFADLVDDEIPF